MKNISLLFLLIISLQVNAQLPGGLKKISRDSFQMDYDLAVTSLREAHPGFSWYTTYVQMDSLIKAQRSKISDSLIAQ